MSIFGNMSIVEKLRYEEDRYSCSILSSNPYIKKLCGSAADRIEELEKALNGIIDVAMEADGDESFPSHSIESSIKVLKGENK